MWTSECCFSFCDGLKSHSFISNVKVCWQWRPKCRHNYNEVAFKEHKEVEATGHDKQVPTYIDDLILFSYSEKKNWKNILHKNKFKC